MQKMLTIDRIKLKISHAMNLQHFEIGFGMVIQKISFEDLPKFSSGENQLAHRILCTRFS